MQKVALLGATINYKCIIIDIHDTPMAVIVMRLMPTIESGWQSATRQTMVPTA